jgi:hypothetical protein
VGLAIALYLMIFFVMSTVLVSSTDDPTAITRQYRAVLGESPPTGFQPAFSVRIVGRRLAVFLSPMQGQTLLLYSESWLAGSSDLAALARVPDRALRFLEVDYSDLGRQSGTMLRIPVEIRGIDVNLNGARIRGFIASMTGRNGRPALLCLVGAPESTTATAREMFRRER